MLSYIEGVGWELKTNKQMPAPDFYYDKETQKTYTKQEAIEKIFPTNKELFHIVKVTNE